MIPKREASLQNQIDNRMGNSQRLVRRCGFFTAASSADRAWGRAIAGNPSALSDLPLAYAAHVLPMDHIGRSGSRTW